MQSEDFERLMKAACDYQGRCMQARQANSEKYRSAESSEENILRILLDGQVASLTETMSQRIERTNDALSYQLSVSASFIRTHFLISDLILGGDVIEAVTLVRKQLESLARLHELDSKPFEKLTGKVPNIQNILKGESKRLYGQLSEVAHFAKPRVGELLHVIAEGELTGPSLVPRHTESCLACWDMNVFVAIYFLAWMTEKLPQWYEGYDNKREQELLARCVLLAEETGAIRIPREGES